MASDEPQWQQLIDGLRRGEEHVLHDFFDRHGRVLHQIAENHLISGVRRRVDADDVVQSTFRTFFRRAEAGQFQFTDSKKLWSLLCAITLTKVREKTRFHLRQKRSLKRESRPDADQTNSFDVAGSEMSPAATAEFSDQFRLLLESLSGEERQIVELRLQDYTNEEIAAEMGISERTVRRILKRLQVRLDGFFSDDD